MVFEVAVWQSIDDGQDKRFYSQRIENPDTFATETHEFSDAILEEMIIWIISGDVNSLWLIVAGEMVQSGAASGQNRVL